MADITTLSSANRHTATEILSQQALMANSPALLRMHSLVHTDFTMDGANSLTRKINKYADQGVASAGAEATDPSPIPTVELDNAAAVSGAVSMGVKEVAELSEDLVTTELGLTSSQAYALFTDQVAIPEASWTNMLRPYIMQMAKMGYRKIETDIIALMASLSNTVGDGSAAVIELIDLCTAIFQHRKQNPTLGPQFGRFALYTNQIERLTKEALFAAGGIGGSLWNNQADFGMANVPEGQMQANGFFGTFLRRPLHELPDDLANVDTGAQLAGYGNFGVPGVSADAPQLGGASGAFEISYKTPLTFRVQPDVSKATIEVTMLARYLAWEVADGEAVQITTKDES